MENMETHLKSAYGFNKFRDYQKEIITDLLDKEDVFAILPTGGGKSLLYQFPATYTKKTTIVISPLISLMNDQCQYLNSKNIKCVCLNSETCVDVSEYKDYQIIYATPEFITSRIKVFERVAGDIGLFAVDEAHCVSQWSHDFRESYQKLGIIKERFPQIPLLAVTATATPRVLDEMYEFLNITEACEYSLGTRRTNLEISVRPKSEFSDCKFDEPTIVYVQTRKICEKLSADLKAKGVTTAYYHGGMEKEDKEAEEAKEAEKAKAADAKEAAAEEPAAEVEEAGGSAEAEAEAGAPAEAEAEAAEAEEAEAEQGGPKQAAHVLGPLHHGALRYLVITPSYLVITPSCTTVRSTAVGTMPCTACYLVITPPRCAQPR